jgi:chemotaxis protein MotB
MAAAGSNERPILVKKIKKVAGGHHGGAWKVAYADFVTAMMAFFLLLWLLNATTEDQRKGIADYFSPAAIARSTSGAGGMLGGRTLIVDGNRPSAMGVQSIVASIAPPPTGENDETNERPDRELPPSERGAKATDKEVAERLAEQEQQAFKQAEEALRQAIQSNPAARELAKHLLVDNTPEGLRIQLVDQEQSSMFATGSSTLNDRAKNLAQLVAQVVAKMPNKLSISGHTDSTPYRFGNAYGNWELSTDRANASRRALIEAGVAADRIRLVKGQADQQPLLPTDPANPSNRRISIVLLRDQPVAGTKP